MRENMTNKEEAEWLKEWWKNYGQSILIAVIVGLCAGFGYKYFKRHEQQRAIQASDLYMQTQTMPNSTASAKAATKVLMREYGHSIYAQMAALSQAKHLALQSKYQQAIQTLKPILTKPAMPGIGQLTQVRVAQLYLQLKQPQQALDAIAVVNDKSFLPMVDMLRASAYRQLGQDSKAQHALQQAIVGYDKLSIDTSMLRLNKGMV